MTTNYASTAIEWCAYFDSWRRFEFAGELYLQPPSGVVTAGDIAAAIRTGVTYARATMRQNPQPGIFLAFRPSPAWHEFMRTRPTMCDGYPGSGATDVVDLDGLTGDASDRMATPRLGVESMAQIMRGGRS